MVVPYQCWSGLQVGKNIGSNILLLLAKIVNGSEKDGGRHVKKERDRQDEGTHYLPNSKVFRNSA